VVELWLHSLPLTIGAAAGLDGKVQRLCTWTC